MSEKLRKWVEMRERLPRWFARTNNPLYAWEAIAICLDEGEPLPEWCIPYLRRAAKEVYCLSCRSDGTAPNDQVAEALGLSKKGKRNAFKRLIEDHDAMRRGIDAVFYGKEEAVRRAAKKNNVQPRQAKQIVAKGLSLDGRKAPARSRIIWRQAQLSLAGRKAKT